MATTAPPIIIRPVPHNVLNKHVGTHCILHFQASGIVNNDATVTLHGRDSTQLRVVKSHALDPDPVTGNSWVIAHIKGQSNTLQPRHAFDPDLSVTVTSDGSGPSAQADVPSILLNELES